MPAAKSVAFSLFLLTVATEAFADCPPKLQDCGPSPDPPTHPCPHGTTCPVLTINKIDNDPIAAIFKALNKYNHYDTLNIPNEIPPGLTKKKIDLLGKRAPDKAPY